MVEEEQSLVIEAHRLGVRAEQAYADGSFRQALDCHSRASDMYSRASMSTTDPESIKALLLLGDSHAQRVQFITALLKDQHGGVASELYKLSPPFDASRSPQVDQERLLSNDSHTIMLMPPEASSTTLSAELREDEDVYSVLERSWTVVHELMNECLLRPVLPKDTSTTLKEHRAYFGQEEAGSFFVVPPSNGDTDAHMGGTSGYSAEKRGVRGWNGGGNVRALTREEYFNVNSTPSSTNETEIQLRRTLEQAARRMHQLYNDNKVLVEKCEEVMMAAKESNILKRRIDRFSAEIEKQETILMEAARIIKGLGPTRLRQDGGLEEAEEEEEKRENGEGTCESSREAELLREVGRLQKEVHKERKQKVDLQKQLKRESDLRRQQELLIRKYKDRWEQLKVAARKKKTAKNSVQHQLRNKQNPYTALPPITSSIPEEDAMSHVKIQTVVDGESSGVAGEEEDDTEEGELHDDNHMYYSVEIPKE